MGANAAQNSKFDDTVKMWVFEETVNGRKLTEVINTDHENVKYLPGHKLPANVVRKCLFLIIYPNSSSDLMPVSLLSVTVHGCGLKFLLFLGP